MGGGWGGGGGLERGVVFGGGGCGSGWKGRGGDLKVEGRGIWKEGLVLLEVCTVER